MINPAEVTNYNRTQYELEEFILFCINVAGKKSAIEAPKLEVFIERAKDITKETSPFNCIRKLIKLGRLNEIMHWAKLSPYAQRYNSYVAVAKIKDLQTVTLNRLLQVPGIGLKTARFFLSHSREDFDEPMLDTHILRFLRDQGYVDAPKSTPSNENTYHYFANIFKNIARQLGKSVTDLDLEIWKQYSGTAA
jgi:thermostable 8-oxoguanine DNA glycosylase